MPDPLFYIDDAAPRTFLLWRYIDVSEVSGPGPIAFGTYFPSTDTSVLNWAGDYPTTNVHEKGMPSIEAIHGHHGATVVVWSEPDEPTFFKVPEWTGEPE
jgi:hypothetical protein